MAHDPTILLGGPDFNLSLELGAVGDDTHVAVALSALWACPVVDGPWADAGAVGVTEKKGSVSEWLDTKRWRFGLVRMEALASSLPFVVHCIREQKASAEQLAAKIQFGIQTQQPSDWLTLGIPIGVLRSAWSVDNSWITDNQPWLRDLCALLADIADHVHQNAQIVAGVMGEEASGCWRNPTPARAHEAHQGYPPLAVMTAEVIEARGGFVLPIELWKQLAPDVEPRIMSSGLYYVPPRPNAPLTGA
jgi:hypothetical protein